MSMVKWPPGWRDRLWIVAFDGFFTRLMALARRWDGPYPQWFRDWVEAERQASSLRWWEPMLVPGLLQTADYARALFRAWQAGADDELEERCIV